MIKLLKIFFVLFLTVNCSAISRSSDLIMLYYPEKLSDYYPHGGILELIGEIPSSNWSKQTYKGKAYWIGSIDQFTVNLRTKNYKDVKGNFKNGGFNIDRWNNYFLEIFYKEPIEKGIALYVRVFGLDKKPGNLTYIYFHNLNVKKDKKSYYFPLNPNYFKFEGETRTPDVKFIDLPVRYNKDETYNHPCIKFYFKENSSQKETQKDSSQKETQGDSSQKETQEHTETVQIPSWVSNDFGILGINFLDESGKITRNDKWEYPYKDKPVSDINYKQIWLITPFGDYYCGKISEGILSIGDFNEKLIVTIAKPCKLILYSCKDEKNYYPIFMREILIDEKQDTIEMDIPISSCLKLSAIKEGNQLNERSIRISDTEIDMRFFQQTFKIKTSPSDAMITVKSKDGYVLFTGISGTDGSLSMDLFLGEGKIIKVEKQGYASKEQNLSDSQTSLEINLTRISPLSFIEFEGYKEVFNNSGIDPDLLQIEIKKDNVTIFKGPLNSIVFIPEEATRFMLSAAGPYRFIEKKISSGKKQIEIKDLLPSDKEIDISLQLVSQHKATLKPGTQVLTFSSANNKHHGKINLPIKYNPANKKFFVEKKKITLCSPGFEPYSLLLPDESSGRITLNRIPTKMVVVISGNKGVTGKYYNEAMKAVAGVWNKIDKVFIAEQGKIKPINSPEGVKGYFPASDNTDFYIKEEINQAKSHVKAGNNICGNPVPSCVVYIAKMRRIPDKSLKLYIISPDNAPENKWGQQWQQASDSNSIKDVLNKISNGL